jgi:hypothetical protein
VGLATDAGMVKVTGTAVAVTLALWFWAGSVTFSWYACSVWFPPCWFPHSAVKYSCGWLPPAGAATMTALASIL